jgi:hypothetical protein
MSHKQLAFTLLIVAAATSARAQTGQTKPVTGATSSTMQVQLPTPRAETPVPLLGSESRGIDTLSFTTPDANFERTLVKGAPFSADSVTEHVQILADGNRMGRKSTAHIFRDAVGRTRREHELTRGNVIAADGQPPRLIIISDPVGQVEYEIETQAGTARKINLPPARVMEAMQRSMGGAAPFSVLMPTSTAHRRQAEGDNAQPLPQPVREKLPSQIIEGVMAEGTRTTITIPAGEFDNDQPMVISHEEWYAPELRMIILMKHGDPRFGETSFRLTNILRGEPAAELFELPSGYKVIDGRGRRELPDPDGRPPLRRP